MLVSRVRFVSVACAAAVVLVSGATAGSPVAAADEAGPTPVEEAEFDAAVACTHLATLAGGDGAEDYAAVDDPRFWRIGAVGFAARAAELGDDSFRQLGEAGTRLLQSWQRIDVEMFDEAVDAMRETCDDVPSTFDGRVEEATAAAEFDAFTACTLLARIPEHVTFDDLSGIDDPRVWRLQAIASFGRAAELGDERFGTLGDGGLLLLEGIALLRGEVIDEAMATLRGGCENLALPGAHPGASSLPGASSSPPGASQPAASSQPSAP